MIGSQYHESKLSTEMPASAKSKTIIKWKTRRRRRPKTSLDFGVKSSGSRMDTSNNSETKRQSHCSHTLNMHNLNSVLACANHRVAWPPPLLLLLLLLVAVGAGSLAATRPPDGHPHMLPNVPRENQGASQMTRPELNGEQVAFDFTAQDNADLLPQSHTKRSVQSAKRTFAQAQQQEQHSRAQLAFGPPEPPALVEYSNSSGATIQCRPAAAALTADARITISWRQLVKHGGGGGELLLFDEREVPRTARQRNNRSRTEASGPLVRPDGALLLPAFDPATDRQAPAQTFRCCLGLPLANDAGAHTGQQPATLCSRLVTTRAVPDSYLPPAELVVFDKLTRPNQLATLRCQAPAHLTPHLELINWLKDDRILPTVDETKLARRLALGANDDFGHARNQLKYLTTSRGPDGELIIRNVSRQLDAGPANTYKCRVRNKLTGRVTTSETGAKLIILDDQLDQTGGGPLHAINETNRRVKVVLAQEQTDVLICAEFPSHSLEVDAKFQWSRVIEGRRVPLADSRAIRSTTSEYKQLDSCLLISQVQHERHSGEYTCDAVGASGAGQTFRVLVVASKLDVQLQVSSTAAASSSGGQQASSEHEDRTQQQSVVVAVSANARPQKVNRHFVTFGSPVQLNCSVTAPTGNGQSTPWQPQVDTIAWFKDSRLLFASKLPVRPSQDHRHLTAFATNQSTRSAPSNLRLVQPTVIVINSFDLHHRGIYQCLMFSSSSDDQFAGEEEEEQQNRKILIEQVRDFLGEAESEPPRNRSSAASRAMARTDFHREASLWAAQLESAGLQRAASVAVAVDLDLVLSQPQLVQKFPVASSHAQGAQMSLECSASGLPAPTIIWLLDDFVIRAPEPDQMVLSSTGSSHSGTQSSATVRELVAFVASSEERNLDGETTKHWPLATTGGQVLRDTSNEMLNVMDEEPRFQVTSRQLDSAQGQVTSVLNVTNLQQVDTGQYTCLALNAHGRAAHSGRVLVLPQASGAGQQPDQVQSRSYQPTNVTLTAGSNATLHCPLVGHQVARVDWFHAGQRLPTSRRQRIGIATSGSRPSGQQLDIENVDPGQDGGVYTCQAHLGDQGLEQVVARGGAHAAAGETRAGAQQVVYKTTSETSQVPAEAQVRVRVHVPPLIDVQSLPEIVQATEGMRTKLVCSIVQGDPGPIEIRWLRRVSDPKRTIRLTGGSRQLLVGYESMQNVAAQTSSLAARATSDATNEVPPGAAASDSITVHNLDDSCLLTFKQIAHLDSGDYLCLAQNELGFSARQVRVVVSVSPSWSLEPPENVYVLQHERLQLDCLAYGHPQPVASWRRAGSASGSSGNFKPIPHAANGTLVIDPVDETDAGLYLCEQTNGIGSGLSRPVRLHVQVPPHFVPTTTLGQATSNRVSAPIGHATGRLGQFAELKCLVLGDQPLLVGWRKEQPAPEVIDLMQDKRRQVTTVLQPDVGQQQALESTLNVTNLSRADSGLYSCIASNEFGTREHQLRLLVQEPPEELQLMRPIKAESRQATLTFKRPFDGNSPVSRYAIHYRHLPDWHSPLAAWPDHQVDDVGGGGGVAQSPIDSDQWKQVLVDAPQQQQQRQLAATSEAAPSELVNLNLCCLKPFSRYAVRVRALNELGPSELSKPVRFQTQEETIGGPPLDVSVEPTGAHSLKVRWREPARQLQNGLIRGYYIGYRALVGQPAPLQSPAHMSALMGGPGDRGSPIDSSEQYQYKNVQLDLNPMLVASLSSSGPGDPLTTSPAQFVDPSVDQPGRESMLAALSGHNVSSSTSSSSSSIRDQKQLMSTYLTNLRRKTGYSIIVQAYNKVGAGPRSDQVLVATLDAAPPMSPLLKLVSATHNSAQFAWSARKFHNQNRRISQLELGTISPPAVDPENDGDDQDDQDDQDDDDDPQAYYTLNYKLDDRYLQTVGGRDADHLMPPTKGGSRTGEQIGVSQQPGEWQQKRVAKRGVNLGGQQLRRRAKLGFVLAGLRCGSPYLAYMTATNSLGQSEPGETIKFATRGGAPAPPQSAQDFLAVNSTYLIMRLDAWHAPGCPIRSFTIKYKLANQAKWIVLEHQVYPTIQTITIAGTSIFSTRPASVSPVQLINSQQMASEAAASSPPPSPPARLGDFILRNLLALAQYKLVVEANSEAGSSLVEYEFDTTNLTSSTLAVQVNGLAAESSEQQADAEVTGKRADNDQFARIANSGHQERGAANSIMNSFSSVWTHTGGGGGGGGGTSHSGRSLATSQAGLGVWTLTVVFVFASIVMAITTLVLGVKSLLRLKQTRCAGTGGGHSSNEAGLASTLLCCATSSSSSASSSSSSASSGSSSSSGSRPRNCYASQMAAPPGALNSADLYCSLPNERELGKYQHANHIALTSSPGASCPGADFGAPTISGLLRDHEPAAALETSYGCAGHYGDNQSSCARPAHSLVPSASLSAILNGQQHRYSQAPVCNNNNHNRHALTLAPVNRMNRTSGYGGERAQPSSDSMLRQSSHYAATLGRQQQQQQQQPIKFNQSHALGADSETQFNQLFSAALLKQQSDLIAADRMTATSGYGTSASIASAGNFNCSQSFGCKPLTGLGDDQQPAGGYLHEHQQQLARSAEQYEPETTTTTADGITCYGNDGAGNEQRTKHNTQGQLAFVGMQPPPPPVDLYNCAGLQVDGGQQFVTHTSDGMIFNGSCSQNAQF